MIIKYLDTFTIISGGDVSKKYIYKNDIESGRISEWQREDPRVLMEEGWNRVIMNDEGYSLVIIEFSSRLKEMVKIYNCWGFKTGERKDKICSLFILFNKEEQKPIIEIDGHVFFLDGTDAKVPNFSEPLFPENIHRCNDNYIPKCFMNKPIKNNKLKPGFWKEIPEDIKEFFEKIKEPMTDSCKQMLSCAFAYNYFENSNIGYDHFKMALDCIERSKDKYNSCKVELSNISERNNSGFSEEVAVACELSDSISDVMERLVIGASLYYGKDPVDCHDIKLVYDYTIPKINDIYVFILKYEEALKYIDMYGLGNKKIPSSIFKKLEIKRKQLLPNHRQRIESYKTYLKEMAEIDAIMSGGSGWIH